VWKELLSKVLAGDIMSAVARDDGFAMFSSNEVFADSYGNLILDNKRVCKVLPRDDIEVIYGYDNTFAIRTDKGMELEITVRNVETIKTINEDLVKSIVTKLDIRDRGFLLEMLADVRSAAMLSTIIRDSIIYGWSEVAVAYENATMLEVMEEIVEELGPLPENSIDLLEKL
jgi:hypothetical protein